MRKLTHKQQLWVYEYISNGFNSLAATRKVYTNCKTEGTLRRMSYNLTENNRVMQEVDKVRNDILENKKDLARETVQNLKQTYEMLDEKVRSNKYTEGELRIYHNISRTLLEVSGEIGKLQSATQVNVGAPFDIRTLNEQLDTKLKEIGEYDPNQRSLGKV